MSGVDLAVVILAYNEEKHIGRALKSLAGLAREIFVIDSESTDRTVEIAAQKGARVVTHDWQGFGPQKNFALSLAQGEWVLSIDADERVSPALAREIVRAIAEGRADGYEIPRLSRFAGRAMRHSGWFPDYVLRLFRRGKARFSDDLVHERVILDGREGFLLAVANAEGTYYRYMKAWLAGRRHD